MAYYKENRAGIGIGIGTLANEIKRFSEKFHRNEGFSSEDRALWDRLNNDYDTLRCRLEVEQRQIQLARESVDGEGEAPRDFIHPEDRNLAIRGWIKAGCGRSKKELTKRERAAMKALGIKVPKIKPESTGGEVWDRNLTDPDDFQIEIPLNPDFRQVRRDCESRALTTYTGPAGGYVASEGFAYRLETALLSFAGPRNAGATVVRTDEGTPFHYPTAKDSQNEGVIISENTANSPADPTFGSIRLGAYLYTSKQVLVPVEMVEDTGIDLEGWLGDVLGTRIARAQGRHFSVGTGAGQPNGVVTVSPTFAAASPTSIQADDIIKLRHSIDPAYWPNSCFAMSSPVLQSVRLLKDGAGRPLWSAGLSPMGPDTLDGRPCYVWPFMASTIQSGAKTVFYGDITRFVIRDVRNVRLKMCVETYGHADQVLFTAYLRSDGNLADAQTNPCKVLLH